MVSSVEEYVKKYIVSNDSDEKEFLNNFSKAEYKPELLFRKWAHVLENANESPAAKWKLLNLQNKID